MLVVCSLVHPLERGDLVRTVDNAMGLLAGALIRGPTRVPEVNIKGQMSPGRHGVEVCEKSTGSPGIADGRIALTPF